jgi:hypothetical protein
MVPQSRLFLRSQEPAVPAVALDIRRNFQGDWELQTDAPHEEVDAHKVKFVLPLKSREQRKFAYVLTTRLGTNATR